MPTTRKTFDSTAIAYAEYDDETETLNVTFRNGMTYDLNGVPEETAQAFFDAQSPGGFWHSQLKDNY